MKLGFGVSSKCNKYVASSACLLIILATIFLSFSVSPSKAQTGPVLTVTPSQGISGTVVSIYGLGFPSGGSVSIDFGDKHMTNGYPGMFGRINTAFSVPSVPYGTYTVKATGAGGVSATATFTVTSVAASSTNLVPNPTYSNTNQGSNFDGSSFGFTSIPTQAPPVKAKAGFWSPLAIGAVAAVVVIGVLFPTVFIIRRRRSSDLLTYEESKPSPTVSNKPAYGTSSPYSRTGGYPSSPYSRSTSSFPQKKSTYSSSYRPTSSYGNQVISQRPVIYHRTSGVTGYSSVQTARNPSIPYRPGQSKGYSSFSSSTKICPHCKLTVKTDYSICPYCRKKL